MITKFNRLSGVDDSGYWIRALGMQKGQLSRFNDGETLDSELLNELALQPRNAEPGKLSSRLNAGRYPRCSIDISSRDGRH